MNILFARHNKNKVSTDIQLLKETEMHLKAILASSSTSSLTANGKMLYNALHIFQEITRRNPRIPFPYQDVLKSDLYCYKHNMVPVMDNFTGKVQFIPFREMSTKCNLVYLKNGNTLSYPSKMKIGNEAIGQAWLEDGTEIFSPRHALIHSLQSTTKRILNWVICFRQKLMEE